MVNFKKGETYVCTKSNRMWWTVGREYKVVLNRHGDTALPDNEGHKWTVEALEELDDYNTQFKPIKETQPQKPVVLKVVADWFEENKDDLDTAIFEYLVLWEERYTDSVLYQWFAKSKNKPIETLVRMKDGYEVEKEPKYIVKIGKLYLKEPLGDTSNFTILTTWDKKCAYPFSSFHMADIHAAKFEGTVEELETAEREE